MSAKEIFFTNTNNNLMFFNAKYERKYCFCRKRYFKNEKYVLRHLCRTYPLIRRVGHLKLLPNTCLRVSKKYR